MKGKESSTSPPLTIAPFPWEDGPQFKRRLAGVLRDFFDLAFHGRDWVDLPREEIRRWLSIADDLVSEMNGAPVDSNIRRRQEIFAAGYEDPEAPGSYGMFAGPSPRLEDIEEVVPDKKETRSHTAYILYWDLDEVVHRIARWDPELYGWVAAEEEIDAKLRDS